MFKKAAMPKRTCCGCREIKSKLELLAITRLKDGTIIVQDKPFVAGRSAYVCRKASCVDKVFKGTKKDALSKSLKTNLTPSIRLMIEQSVKKHHD